MKRTIALSIILLAVIIGCGGHTSHRSGGDGGGGTTTTAQHLIASFTSHPVTGMSFRSVTTTATATTTSSLLAGLLPMTASAATTPSTQPQSFEGVCNTIPAFDATGLLQGAGRWDDADCGANWTDRNPEGAPVYKDGTLTQLVAFVGGTGVDDTDGVVDVSVWHNGAFTVTTFTCTLGLAKRCDMTGSVPVFDGDQLNIRAHTKAGNSYRNLRVVVTKE